jgi:hypothetical protein
MAVRRNTLASNASPPIAMGGLRDVSGEGAGIGGIPRFSGGERLESNGFGAAPSGVVDCRNYQKILLTPLGASPLRERN